MIVKKAAKSDRHGNQWEVFVIIRLRGLGLVRLVHRFQAFSQTCIFIKLSLQSAWNFHKMLQYWQRKAASLLPPTEWGWDVDCTLDIPYTYNGLDNGDAENARHELAGHENARNAIVWNTECCICLSIAEQECMSSQERAPDFAADCVFCEWLTPGKQLEH